MPPPPTISPTLEPDPTLSLFFTDEQLARRDRTVEFARSELGKDLLTRDRDGTFLREDWTRCAEHGILGASIPTEYGGQGLDTVSTVLMLEAVGYGCRDNGLSLALGAHTWNVVAPLLLYGTEEQKQRFLPRMSAGELISCNGISEENSGSDAFNLETTARKVDGGYVLNGRKAYIGMAPLADMALILANSNPEAGKWGVSAFLVERDAGGFSVSEPRAKLGTRTNPMGDLVFEDCWVPENNRLGGEGAGIGLFTRIVAYERAFILAGHVGAMQALFEKCVDYAKSREQFGSPIGSFQSISNRIANMRVRLETSRLLMYRVAAKKDRSEDAALEGAMAKLHIAEALLESATDAVRIHGARGYLEEFEIERDLRDMVGSVIYAGTSDIQRNLIAGLMGLKPS